MMDYTIYDADYYDRGIESGKSCYSNYRWIPEMTIPMAMTIIDYLNIKRGELILDYGCAKGFLVKALRLLYRSAYGYDVSQYALDNCDEKVKSLCCSDPEFAYRKSWDFCISKDVFEHIPESELTVELNRLHARTLFAVVPLGDDNGFYAPANNMDITHVTCKPQTWWASKFVECGWGIESVTCRVPGIKDSYYPEYPDGHGFFFLKK